MSSVFLFIVCLTVLSSIHANQLPANYTLPPGSENLCFAARFDLILNVEYTQINGKTNLTRIPLNNETFEYYSGTCGLRNSHTLTINMLDNLTSITFEFNINEKNQTSLTRVLGSITINETSRFFPNASTSAQGLFIFKANESLFETDINHSYRCNSKTKIENFKSKHGNVTIKSIDIENLRVQPFTNMGTPFHDYAAEKVCTMDYFRPSNIIPIVVGICLALLVIGVLVAYLIGRRRNRNGYQSV